MALMFQHILFQADSTCNVMWINSSCRFQKGESIPKHILSFNPYSTSLYLSRNPFSLCNRSVPELQLNATESHLSYPESQDRMPDLHLAVQEWHLTLWNGKIPNRQNNNLCKDAMHCVSTLYKRNIPENPKQSRERKPKSQRVGTK